MTSEIVRIVGLKMDGVMTGPSQGRRARQYKEAPGRHSAQGKEPTHTSTPIKGRLGETPVHKASRSRRECKECQSPRVPRPIVSKSQSPAPDTANNISKDSLSMSKPMLSSTATASQMTSLSYSAPVCRKPPQPSADLSNVRQNLNASLAACEALTTDKSDTKSLNTSFSNTSLAYLKQPREFENKTIQKQRQELELLIGELRDRDRELNEMVLAHREQMKAWEMDRQKILMGEEKNAKLQRDLQLRNDDMRALVAKLRIAENEDQNKSTALNSTQEQLSYITEQQSHTSLHLQDLEEKNKQMSSSVRDMTTAVGQMEAREQELVVVLKMKDRDLSESSSHIAELGAKLKKVDSQNRESKEAESDMRRCVSDWKNKYLDISREYDHLKRQYNLSEQRSEQDDATMKKLKQDISTLKKEVILANEREKRKDQLLELQRSKQERSDAELASVRQLYERQQRDLSLLHLNLESTKDTFSTNKAYDGSGPIRASEYQSRSYSPTAVGSYSPTAVGSYSPSRARTYSPSRTRDSCPRDTRDSRPRDRAYSPPRTYQPAGTRSTPALENGRVEPLFTSSTSPYTSQGLATTGYSVSTTHANTGAGDIGVSTGNAYITPTRKPVGERTADDDSHQSTPVSSASKQSTGSHRSENGHQSRPGAANGELDNSLEELTMSKDDQASSQSSPEADKSVASERSTSTVQSSLASLTPRQSQDDIQQEEIDNIFSKGDREGLSTEEILERSTTPVQPGGGDEPGQGLTKTQLVMASSVKQTDSPATKLHKLLTESRDMVQELEKSAVVQSQEHQPDLSASEAIPSPSDTDAD